MQCGRNHQPQQQHQQRTCSLARDRRAMVASSSGSGSSRRSNSGIGSSGGSSSSSGRRSSIQQQQAQRHSATAAPGAPAVLDKLQVAVHIVEQLRHHKVGAGINLRQPELVGQRREGVTPRVLATGLVPA